MFKIDYIFSSDISDIEFWNPINIEDVYFGLEIEMRWNNEKETSIFQVVVVSPEALINKREQFINPISGRYYIIIADYSWKKVYNFIQDRITECNVDSNKDETIKNMLKFFFWEYENHNID